MKVIQVNDGTITKKVEILPDPKRPGLKLCRCYDENGNHISTLWGKSNQAEIEEHEAGA